MAMRDVETGDAGTDSETLERLRTEISALEGGGGDDAPGSDQAADAILEEVVQGTISDEGFEFADETVKDNLNSVLLTLVAGRSADSNGKHLMDDLGRAFDSDLSPGTVYPKLHDLEEAGLLEKHELVRTKEYDIADAERFRERITEQMRQHLALGMYFHHALEEL